jgi:hypothetical protein
MSKVDQLERMIEQLPPEDFEKLSAWIEQKRHGQPTENLAIRDHSAFLNGYAPEDEGLYNDAASG